jgi:uncharacterized protein (DUF58 family)
LTLLSPALLARLETLQIGNRHRLMGRFGGEHVSKRYGNTVDFADFREYHPGDDFRRIDYHVLARLDQVLIKLFEADDEVTLRLLVDVSASMRVGGKLDQAKRIAAALGFVALTAHDAVTVHTFPRRGPAPRFTGRAAAPGFFGYLEALEPEGETPFASATGELLASSSLPGVTVVLSDLLTPQWRSLVSLRAGGSDLLVIHVTCAEDLRPDFHGDLELVDAEDRRHLTVSITEEVIRNYVDRIADWRAEVSAATAAAGGVLIEVDAGEDLEQLLLRTWRRLGILR